MGHRKNIVWLTTQLHEQTRDACHTLASSTAVKAIACTPKAGA